jgi:hypothetical protein
MNARDRRSTRTVPATARLRSARAASRSGAARFASLLVPLLVLSLAAAERARAFDVQGAFPFGPAHVGIAFTDSVDVARALQRTRYALVPRSGAPALAVQSVALQENHRTVILATTSSLPPDARYDVVVSGVESRHGDPLATGTGTLVTPPGTITGIAAIHADLNALIGRSVTIVGQVFVTGASSGGTPSAWIQDGTGRGINLYGSPPQTAVDTVGNVVLATGTVALYFTTVELTPFTATTIASRMPPLAPKQLTIPQASGPQWEGTYILSTGTLSSAPTASGSSHTSYPVSDGGRSFIFRVRNTTGHVPGDYHVGDVLTAAGAGSAFQSTYQITVGDRADFYRGPGPGDRTPPVLVAASGEGGASTVRVEFSEPVAAGSGTPSNYTLYPTASPSGPIAIATAAANGAVVSLNLAAPLVAGTEYTLEVSGVADAAGNLVPEGAALAFTATTPVGFEVAGAFPFGARAIGVGFTQRVNVTQALALAHYAFDPPLAIESATLQENGQTVILRAAADLPVSTTWQLAVSGVTSATGEPLAAADPLAVATPAAALTDIATIQADPAAWSGRTVALAAQVFVPVGSRGGTPSGYVQDGSGRGVNLFGGSIQGPVNALGNVALVEGTVAVYFTTVEITGYTATLLASGQPHLGARRLTVAQANSTAWEGTYIETQATLTNIQPSGTSNYGYDATDAGALITFRVGNGLGIEPAGFQPGDRVVGRGAGGSFQSTFQINVGNVADFGLAGAGGPDTVKPVLLSATGAAGGVEVRLSFSEPMSSNEATVVANYGVGAEPGGAIAVTDALLESAGRAVTLTLARPLEARTRYTVIVANVADLAGNVIAPGASADFTPTEAAAARARLRIPPVTLIKNLAGHGETLPIEIAGPDGASAVCRIYDLQGRLVKVLFDGDLGGTPRRALAWNGRDEMFEFVPAGAYVCHLEVTDPTGRVTRDVAPIVVAVRLRQP